MKKILKKYQYPYLFISSLILLGVIFMLVFFNHSSLLDKTIYDFLIFFKTNWLTNFFKVVTNLANAYVLITIIGIILIIKRKEYSFYLALNLVVVTYLNQIVKHLLKRPRPLGIALINQGGYSFPSGHAMAGIAFYGLLIFFIWQSQFKYKKFACLLLATVILIIGLSRIYLGVHYASDVIGGLALGLVCLIAFINIFTNKFKKLK